MNIRPLGAELFLCAQTEGDSERQQKPNSIFLQFFKHVYKYHIIYISVNKSPDSILKCVAILLHVHNALVSEFSLGSSPVD